MNEENFDIRSYFTEEIDSKISGMTNEEMTNLLKSLINLPEWIAILKYNQGRLRFAQDFLFTADPAKDPTNIARNQGVMMGISDLQNAVISLDFASKKANKGEEVE